MSTINQGGLYHHIAEGAISESDLIALLTADGFDWDDFKFIVVPGDGFYAAAADIDGDEVVWMEDNFGDSYSFGAVYSSLQGFYLGAGLP